MEGKSILQRLEESEKKLAELTGEVPKERSWRIPRKGKVNKRKARKGYVIVGVINNGNIDFVKKQVDKSTYELDKGDTFHATDGHESVMYKGAPLLIQHKGKLNPVDLRFDGKNETYGQKYVMARMTGDALKLKKAASGLIWVILIIVAAAVVGKMLHWF